MADKVTHPNNIKDIYPKSFPAQTDKFSDNQEFKYEVFKTLREVAVDSTKKAFEDKGYKEKESYAGVYGDGSKYGQGIENDKYNIKLSSRANVITYFEKLVYLGARHVISVVEVKYNPDAKNIEVTYKSSDYGSYHGYGDTKNPNQFIHDVSVFNVGTIADFKKEVEAKFKTFAEKEVAYLSGKMSDVATKVKDMVKQMSENRIDKILSLKDLASSSFEDLSTKVVKTISESKSKSEEEKNADLKMNVPETLAGIKKDKLQFDNATGIENYAVKDQPNNILLKYKSTSLSDIPADEKKAYMEALQKENAELYKMLMEKEGIDEITAAGPAGAGAGAYKTPFAFKKGGDLHLEDKDEAYNKTPYARANANKKHKDRSKLNEGSSFWTQIDTVPGSGYVPKGMEHNYVGGHHSVAWQDFGKKQDSDFYGKGKTVVKETGEWSGDKDDVAWMDQLKNEIETITDNIDVKDVFQLIDIKGFDKYKGPYANVMIFGKPYKIWTAENDELWIENYPKDNTSGPDTNPGFKGDAFAITDMINDQIKNQAQLNESKFKRKFTTLTENTEKGMNKRYIITEKRNEDEEKNRWKKLALFETYETIKNAENIVKECECEPNGFGDEAKGEERVTMGQGQKIAEKEFEQRVDANDGDVVDGRKVIMIAKPGSLSNAMFKLFEDEYLNENRAYIKDLNSGNMVLNPNFKFKK